MEKNPERGFDMDKPAAGNGPTGPPVSPSVSRVIPRRRLGRTGVDVTVLGLGGGGLLRSVGREKEASRLINTAIDLGINYFESASAYADSESYYGAALKGRRADVFLVGKSRARDKAGALAHLHRTLADMKTDYLDLWCVHDLGSEDDRAAIFAPGGAMEAFVEAKEKGLVRFIGVTGNNEPAVVKRCLETFDFDTVGIPVNPAEPSYKCFLEEILPVAASKDVGIIGMKVFLGGRLNAPKRLLLSYALTQPIATAVVGCDTVEQLEENVEAALDLQLLKQKEVQRLNGFVAKYAKELMYYKP
jgi:aryl-alcohol dehydrogenase-like predicted oxidoreductase